MQHTEKEEYLLFMILIKLRYNIQMSKIRLKHRKEWLERDPYNYSNELKYKATLAFCNENIRIAKVLFNINITNDFSEINNEIHTRWSNILEYLNNNKCDYEWTRKDFQETKYYEFYKYLSSYDLYWEIKSRKEDTDPIYFEFSTLRILDNSFNDIFNDIVFNAFFNPNKRTVEASYEPFWADHIPCDYHATDLSDKIIYDKRCNYRMVKNGTDHVLLYLRLLTGFFGNNDLSEDKKSFLLNFIYKIIKENNCSILQEYVDDSTTQTRFILEEPLIYILFANQQNMTTYKEFSDLYKYCISEEGVIDQCNAIQYKTEGINKAVEFYISLIEKDNPENTEGIKLLRNINK